MRRPADYLPAFEEALREVVQSQDPTFAKTTPLSQLKIGLQARMHPRHPAVSLKRMHPVEPHSA